MAVSVDIARSARPDPQVRVSRELSDPAWDGFVATAPGGHHVQTSDWAAVKASGGWETLRLTVSVRHELVAGAQILVKRFRGVGRVGYLDTGPLVPAESDLIGFLVDRIKALAADEGIRLLLVQPPEANPLLGEHLVSAGFGHNHIKAALGATVVVDMKRSEDEILAGMKSKTRYNIRKAIRSGVEVRIGTAADLPALHRLLSATGGRQRFEATSLQTLEEMHRHLGPSHFEVLLAEHEGVLLSGILTIPFGDRVIYKRGGWSGIGGDLHPNELLHWTAMQRARRRGVRWYDFDGIERDVAEAVLAGGELPPKATESVTRFKLGFGGEVVLLPMARTYLPNPVLRWGHDTLYPRLTHHRPVKRVMKRLTLN